jgi:hypothetical protein
MPAVDALFTTVEGYQNMNIDYLSVRVCSSLPCLNRAEPSRV